MQLPKQLSTSIKIKTALAVCLFAKPLSIFVKIALIAFLMIFTSARADEVAHYNRVSLQATASREIAPDLMRLTLYSELRDKNATYLAEATTKILNAAIEKARLVDNVTIQVGNRNAYSISDKKSIIWQERALLHLESSDFVALSALGAQLMGDLKIAEHYFFVSKSRQKEIENSLIEEALIAFDERAQIIMKALGGKSYKIVQLNLDNQGNVMPFMAARDMAIASAQSDNVIPQIEVGTREIAVVVQGMIEIEM